MIIELRSVNVSEVDLIERLFQQVYKQEKGIDYWKWCFKNPYGYINTGLFESNRLIGYYAAHFTKNSACLSLPMIRPDSNFEKVFMILSLDLLSRISLSKSFAYIFSTDKLKPFLLMEDFDEAYQIREYRIPIEEGGNIINWYEWGYNDERIWRYRNHPFIKYIFADKGIFSYSKDCIQIVDYEDSDDLHWLIKIAEQIGYWENKKYVSFWSKQDLSYKYDLIPLWKYYKIFDLNLDLEDVMSLDRLKMGMSENY